MGVLVKHVGACGVSVWFMHVQTIANLFKWWVRKSSPQLLLASTPRWASSIWSWRISQHVWICIKHTYIYIYISNCQKLCKAQSNVRIRGSESHEFAFRINKIGPEWDIYHHIISQNLHIWLPKLPFGGLVEEESSEKSKAEVISACRVFAQGGLHRQRPLTRWISMGWLFRFFLCFSAAVFQKKSRNAVEVSRYWNLRGNGSWRRSVWMLKNAPKPRTAGGNTFSSKTQLRWHICDGVYRAEAAVSKAYPQRAGLGIWFHWTIFNVS